MHWIPSTPSWWPPLDLFHCDNVVLVLESPSWILYSSAAPSIWETVTVPDLLATLLLMQPSSPLQQGLTASSFSACCSPESPFPQSCLEKLPPAHPVTGLSLSQKQDFGFAFVGFHDIPMSPCLQPVENPQKRQLGPPAY